MIKANQTPKRFAHPPDPAGSGDSPHPMRSTGCAKPTAQGDSTANRLLDARFAQRCLSDCLDWPPGWRLRSVRILRVYPYTASRAGLGVQWEVELKSALGSISNLKSQIVQGHVYATPCCGPLARVSKKPAIDPDGTFVISRLLCGLPGTDFVLHTPDRDARLPNIPDVTTGAELRDRLRAPSIARRLGKVRSLKCQCLSYRPYRRCTLAYRADQHSNGDGAFVVGKVYRDGVARRTPNMVRQIASDVERIAGPELRIPRVLAAWRDRNTVVFEGLPGGASGAASLDGATVAEAAGRILACLHRLPIRDFRIFTVADELAATGRWVDLATRLDRFNPCAHRLWDWLGREGSRLRPRRPAVIHRDFYESQIIPTADGWGLVDLDTAAAGDPEQDLGNFVGHLTWSAVRHRGGVAPCDPASGVLLAAYSTSMTLHGRRGRSPVRRLDAARLRFYAVSSLLRVGIIHSLRTGTERSALRLHDIATDWIGGAADQTVGLVRRRPARSKKVRSP